jgi:hypothetical protein
MSCSEKLDLLEDMLFGRKRHREDREDMNPADAGREDKENNTYLDSLFQIKKSLNKEIFIRYREYINL